MQKTIQEGSALARHRGFSVVDPSNPESVQGAIERVEELPKLNENALLVGCGKFGTTCIIARLPSRHAHNYCQAPKQSERGSSHAPVHMATPRS